MSGAGRWVGQDPCCHLPARRCRGRSSGWRDRWRRQAERPASATRSRISAMSGSPGTLLRPRFPQGHFSGQPVDLPRRPNKESKFDCNPCLYSVSRLVVIPHSEGLSGLLLRRRMFLYCAPSAFSGWKRWGATGQPPSRAVSTVAVVQP